MSEKCRVCNEYTHAEWCSAGIPDPRAQAEQRLEIAFEMQAKYPVATDDLVAFAKLAAEEIAKAVGEERTHWSLTCPSVAMILRTKAFPWHLVCADAEKPMSAERDLAIARAAWAAGVEYAMTVPAKRRTTTSPWVTAGIAVIIAQVDKTHDPKTHDNEPDNNHCMGCWYEATHCQVCGNKYELRCEKCQNY